MNDMEQKIKDIKKIGEDVKYLSEEYESIKLWGSAPDGDVKFSKLIEWLTENRYAVEHMISIGELINKTKD